VHLLVCDDRWIFEMHGATIKIKKNSTTVMGIQPNVFRRAELSLKHVHMYMWTSWESAAQYVLYLKVSLRPCMYFGRAFLHETESLVLRKEKDRQCTYNVTLRRVRATTVVGKSNKYYIYRVCVCSLRYPICNAHAPYCHLSPVRL
jgi:hypothetical protein